MKRYAVPLVDQCVVAAFNLALQLVLIRFASSTEYGTFVLWQSLVMVMVGFQDAMIGMPLSLRIAYDRGNHRRFALERQVAALAGLLIAAGAAILLAAVTIATGGGGWLAPAIALFTATFLAYYAVRYLAQSRARFAAALVMDCVYAALSLGTVGALAIMGQVTLVPLFALLSAPALVATVTGYLVLERPPRPRLRRVLRGYATVWRDSRWTVAAVAAAELQNRAFIYAIAAVHGPAALAGVFAGNLVLRHLNMLTMAWTAFGRPFVVGMRDHGQLDAMVKFAAVSAAILIGLYVVNLAALSVAWPVVEAYIYAGRYEEMLPVVRLWTLIYALQVPVTVLALLLTTLGRYREDSLAVALGSAVTVSSVVALALLAGPLEALLGMGLGYLVTASVMGWHLSAEMARRRARVTAAGAQAA